jgi:hypothetical protein
LNISLKRRSTLLLASQPGVSQAFITGGNTNDNLDLPAIFIEKKKLLESLEKGFVNKAAKLLVTVSTLMVISDHRRLSSHVWGLIASHRHVSTLSSVCQKEIFIQVGDG